MVLLTTRWESHFESFDRGAPYKAWEGLHTADVLQDDLQGRLNSHGRNVDRYEVCGSTPEQQDDDF